MNVHMDQNLAISESIPYHCVLSVKKKFYVGGWVVQKSLKTPLHNIKKAP